MCADIIYFLFMGISVFHPCHGLLQTILKNEQAIRNENLVKQFEQLLLTKINFENHYDYIVLVKDAEKSSDCIFEDSIAHVNTPILILSKLVDQKQLRLQHSSNFLLLTCSLQYLHQATIFNTVYQYVPHLIWLEAQTEAVVQEEMVKLCSNIHASGYFQNLIITSQSSNGELKYFNCDFQRHLKSISHNNILGKPFLNVQAISITTESDQLPPRSVVFYDYSGQLKLTGCMANFLTTFAERYNATLVIVPPADIGVTLHYEYLANKTFEGILDIASSAARFKVDTYSESYSYPVEIMQYCYMIPLPHIRPVYKVFLDIIEVKAKFIILTYFVIFSVLLNIGQLNSLKGLNFSNVVFNDRSIRGLLGQSFLMPRKTSWFMKYVLFLLCYSSILLCTCYQAYLQSHLVHPSLEKRMETYDDIRRNNFKILIDEREFLHLPPDTLEHYDDLFVKQNNFHKIVELSNSMDTRYIYPLSQTRWSVIQERQKLFQRKLFYFSSQLCLNNLMLLSFPLRPGLPYKFQFNQHLLDLRDTGLLDCWLEQNFLHMVRLKLSSFKDLSVADEYGAKLNLNDFFWIWIMYAIGILLSLLMFGRELLLM